VKGFRARGSFRIAGSKHLHLAGRLEQVRLIGGEGNVLLSLRTGTDQTSEEAQPPDDCKFARSHISITADIL
jgi:hypothetical protein